jgi:spore maturation protein B
LIAITTCIGMIKASGGLELLVSVMAYPAKLLHLPAELLPLALLRPISGSGALVIYEDLLQSFGPDSQIGKIASVLLGSSETTFYTMTVYYASVSIRKTKYTLPCSLLGDLSCFLFSVLWINLLG